MSSTTLQDSPPAYDGPDSPPLYPHSCTSPPVVYHLRQVKRNERAFKPMFPREHSFNPIALPEYTITSKLLATLSKSRPDYVLKRRDMGSAVLPSSEPSKASANAPMPFQTDEFATIRFPRTGDLPWIPKANITYAAPTHTNDPTGAHSSIEQMKLQRQRDHGWTVTIDGVPHLWCLYTSPAMLELVKDAPVREKPLAYFAYGDACWGSIGPEIGRLTIPRLRMEGRPTVALLDRIVTSLFAVVVYWRNEGKVLRNPGRELGAIVVV